ncbi:putative 4-hydroxyphenylpyruvate dioxygenase [Mycena rosella]|uniref:4-hydroxyphenylpyruvate dioxygenase n=1 Tax=Mycena rosella TaxID=1033263 RepID=A0AAD7H0F9_MYCRO|nr:putative 4-hydroxyphenylpyruvate dioxygenase [Mycena rosella]
MAAISSISLAIPTMTLGRAWVHELEVKVVEAGKAGYQGVEIFWEDLVYAAMRISPDSDEKDEAAMLRAAQYAKDLCDQNRLVVLVLQPFMNYEGVLDQSKHEELIVKLRLWFKIVKILGTDLIQIPSQMNSEGTTGDIGKLVSDMKEVAELGLKENPPVRFAYEALSWGAHLDLWEQVWDIVLKVDLPNFGTVIDTYHILACIYGDPTSPSGLQPDAETALTASLSRLASTPNLLAKLFYVQLSDAERLDPPLSPTHLYHDATQKPNIQWSRNARLFPCEEARGGYLPVEAVAKVLFEDMGFRGWVSMEVFSRTMSDPHPATPRAHAERGIESWKTLLQRLAPVVS